MPLIILIVFSLCSVNVVESKRSNNITDEVFQGCLEESTNGLKPVTWPKTTTYNEKVVSEPLCLTESLELVTRICNKSGWTPEFKNVPECAHVTAKSPNIVCAPTFQPIYKSGKEGINFCYRFTQTSNWSNPCLKSGSPMTVFDLKSKEFLNLIDNLNLTVNKHTWLPIKRAEKYGPLVWKIPGEKWGKIVKNEKFSENNKLITVSKFSVAHNCLLLDLENFVVKSQNCSFQYPTLCVAKEKHLLKLHCPPGYFASQYGLNDGMCYGLHISGTPLTWEEFKNKSCPTPITIKNKYDNYIANELFSNYESKYYNSCWTGLVKEQNKYYWSSNTPANYVNWNIGTDFNDKNVRGAINRKIKWQIFNDETKLPCMICEANIKDKEIEMQLKLTGDNIHLIIYNQLRLWKEDDDDFGIRCFSNAKGFQTRINISESPYHTRRISLQRFGAESDSVDVFEKVVYRLQPISDQSGEYWCEGHDSRNFSLIKSPKLFVSAKDEDQHTFVLKLDILNACENDMACNPDWEEISDILEDILEVDCVRVMLVNNIINTSATVTLHVTDSLETKDCAKNNITCKIHVTYKILKLRIKLAFVSPEHHEIYTFKFIHLKSSEVCMPEYNRSLTWEMANIGETAATVELCMRSDGLPVTRTCEGSFVSGGDWGDIMGVCSENFEPTNRTSYLYNVSKGRGDTSNFIVHDLTTILQNIEDVIPADIFFLSLSLRTILHLSDMNSSAVEIGDSLNIATVINNVMDIEENNFKLAQTMNSSNMFLDSVDIILSKIALNSTDEHFHIIEKDLVVTPHYVIQLSCPNVNNISGLALLKPEDVNETSFEDLDMMELTSDMTLEDVLSIPNLDAAAWVSQELLDSLQYRNVSQNNSTPLINQTIINPRVILGFFYNDVVFQETKLVKDDVNGRIISITIPEYETELSVPVYLINRKLDPSTETETCSYWNLETTETGWSKKGCYYAGSHKELDICACFHLTHFAQLVHGFRGGGSRPEETVVQKFHGKVLNAITMAGCSLSLLGVSGIAITAILFPTWRQKPGSKILLQLSAALALQSIIMLAQDTFHPSDPHCIALGAILHYSVLASFTWMLLTAVLQFARYVRVLGVQRPVRFMMKFSLLGWGLPILPVAILLIVDHNAYLPPATVISEENPQLPPQRDPSALCYPQGMGLVLCCLLPIASIVITNLIVFILVVHSVTRVPEGVRRPTDPDLVMSQLRLSILLFFLFGLSWIFGFFAVTGKLIIFSYLFCLTATLQGFILFMYFIVIDPTTRVLWVSMVREKSMISPSKSSTKEISIESK